MPAKILRDSAYIRRSSKRPTKPPTKLGGWHGDQLWLWRGNPQKLTLVKTKRRKKNVKPDRKERIIKQIRVHTDRIAKERDHLRDLYYELSEIMDTTEDGLREIEYGIDRISEHL